MSTKHKRIIFEEHPFRECVEKHEDLAAMRAEYARKSSKERLAAADWAYHSSIAGRMFDDALARVGRARGDEQQWPDGVVALAIDPLFAPAILTVGSLEYQLGREDEAMELFLTLTTLPADEPDLPVIIDKPGNYLHLNDLGWSLYQAGHLEEARATLEKSLQLAPADYDLVRNNLKEVQEVLGDCKR